jgi:formylglycine-generating enzyme required for sulfatase activity
LGALLVLAGGAWWLGRSGSAPSASSGPTTTSFGYTLAPVPAGTYTIGSPPTEADRSEDETQHAVTLTRGFLLGTTEVTQGQYKALMGTNPVVSQADCEKWGNTAAPADDEPVYCVSWVDAAQLANAASAREGLESCYVVSGENVSWPKGLACTGYRLPTESEWEVAARGGGSGIYAGGSDLGSLGWFSYNSGGRTHPVGQKSPNGYGLYDMSGNVWEWTWGTYGDYPAGSATDPTGATDGPYRVDRGGSWYDAADDARAASRGSPSPGYRYDILGLRLLRTIP